MTRTFRTLTLGLAAAAAFVATPALAQKGGPTPVTEVDKAARSAVHITYACDEVQVCHEYDWNHLELPVTRRDNGPFAGYYYDFYVHAVRV